MTYVIVYKQDGQLNNMDTKYVGPFYSWEMAYHALCSLPAPVNQGHKFIEEMTAPK